MKVRGLRHMPTSGPARPHHTHSLSLMTRSIATAAPPGPPPPPDVTACGTRRRHLLLLRMSPRFGHPTSPRFGHPLSPPLDVSTSVLHRPGCLGRAPPPRSPRATQPGHHHPVHLGCHIPDLGSTPQWLPPPCPDRRPSSSYASQHRPFSALTPAITCLSIPDHHCHRGQRVCYFNQQIKALFAMIKVYASSILCSQTQELKLLVNH
jgi:hypothetical protein